MATEKGPVLSLEEMLPGKRKFGKKFLLAGAEHRTRRGRTVGA